MRDWPGRVASTLRLEGCSLSCPYCTGASATSPAREALDWELIVSEIEAHPWLDGIVVKGGEPTEDPDLPSLLAALSELGRAVRLETNGTRPDVLRHLLAEQLVDCVALDIKTVPGRYGVVAPRPGVASLVAECAELLIRSGVDHEFRTTVHPGCVALEELPRIARSVRGGRLYALLRPAPVRASCVEDPETGGYDTPSLRAAVGACSVYLPTIVRELHETGVRKA